ncbi:DUF4013 domain-containing protein [Halogeometricum limi]|uniref:DUF4013 domain-containing protein n=1 Tax=Halogeometricum limi TaxID=555875 RepID=A0A1I6HW03_9EURY|nr:DUF4013 domain-containing protein [Halogeometricum limi]SFR58623.1 Protein of unknown function [Halogeometricum limi]
MLGDALSYPRNNPDWIPTILIGGVLSVLGVLILPIFIVQGYSVRVMRSAAKGETSAPSFTDWGGLTVDGLKLFVISIAYALLIVIPIVAVTVVLGLGSTLADPTTGPSAAFGVATLLGFLVIGLFGLAIGYFAPAGYANFAVEDSLGAAFDVSTIVSAATTGEYFTAWVLAVLVGLVGGLLGGALSVVIVGIFVVFYVQIVVYYLFGRGFAKGLGKKRRAAAESNV